jgi:hypothetical protein
MIDRILLFARAKVESAERVAFARRPLELLEVSANLKTDNLEALEGDLLVRLRHSFSPD